MATVSKQLTVNVQISNVWTQLLEGSGGLVYALPSSGSPQGDIKRIRLINLATSGSPTVEVALSSGSVISNDRYVLPPIALPPKHTLTDREIQVLRPSEGVWIRAVATSGSPNITARADLLEMT